MVTVINRTRARRFASLHYELLAPAESCAHGCIVQVRWKDWGGEKSMQSPFLSSRFHSPHPTLFSLRTPKNQALQHIFCRSSDSIKHHPLNRAKVSSRLVAPAHRQPRRCATLLCRTGASSRMSHKKRLPISVGILSKRPPPSSPSFFTDVAWTASEQAVLSTRFPLPTSARRASP